MSNYLSITVKQYGGKNGVQMNGGEMSNDQLNTNQSSGCQMHENEIKTGQRNGGQPNEEQWPEERNGDLQTNAGQMIFTRDLEIEHSVKYENWDWVSDPSSSFYSARMEQSLRSNEDQMNEGQTITDQSSAGQVNTTLMLNARALKIEFSGDKKKWKWIREGDSRFPEVAELLPVWYSLIEVTINMDKFLPETNYVAHLIFKTRTDSRGLDTFLMATVTLNKRSDENCALQWKKVVCLKPRLKRLRNKYITLPLERSDGWMELELGQFYCDDGTGKVVVSLQLAHNDYKMSGLIVAGIELHPI